MTMVPTDVARRSWCAHHVTEPSAGAYQAAGSGEWVPGCGGCLDFQRARGVEVRPWRGPERLAHELVLAIHDELYDAPVLDRLSPGDKAEVFVAAATAVVERMVHCTRRPHGASPDGTVDHWHLASPLPIEEGS